MTSRHADRDLRASPVAVSSAPDTTASARHRGSLRTRRHLAKFPAECGVNGSVLAVMVSAETSTACTTRLGGGLEDAEEGAATS
jgi:hypothetical protein